MNQPQQAAIQTTQGGGLAQPSETKQPLAATTARNLAATEMSEKLGQFLGQVQQLQAEKGGLSPDLIGRLDGLLDRLRGLTGAEGTLNQTLPALEALTTQLSQLLQQTSIRPEGGQLGLLSQLFGFHLEAELLHGKKKDALASLKLALLALRGELGEKAEEPLHRLELLQLCKAKLHEDQVQFLPLPFHELEEGYLLAEKRREQGSDGEPEAPLQLSLSLRLSALGNMRIDMLYEKAGLYLRIACEDKEKMGYLREWQKELEGALVTVPLQGVSFAEDARVPLRQLLERLLPGSSGLLDARI